MKMNRLEAQAIIDSEPYYDEEDKEYALEIYNELVKHIGFEDNRIDKRYIVKFHDICYYTPKELEEDDDRFWDLFNIFCEEQIAWMEEENALEGIAENTMFSPMYCGHYQAFKVDIPEITDKNAAELAIKICNEISYEGVEYVKNYVFMVNNLQAMEDNYMDMWIQFLRDGEYIKEESIKEIEEKYKSDKERRK